LNDRICDKIEQKLKAYEGYQLLRVDDTTGATDVSLSNRCKKANSWGADFYLSIHHNAGINGGKGGGVVAYTYTKVDAITASWQKELYDAIIKRTGLKGNRSTPLAKSNLAECRETNMPCVLLECGFMDSTTDVPVILTDDYADKVATACVEVIVKRGKLTKKVVVEQPATGTVYRVQVGAYIDKANAEKLVASLKKDGYDAYITT
jgi:N-acetylmuramoyl-L-alanine amidase